jgi:uncharacterized protein (TIGR02271 family)
MAITQRTVVGVFQDRPSAEQAVADLRRAGFREDQIGFMARDGSGQTTTQGKEARGTNAGEGALAGALAGAGIGGLVGLGVVAGVIPVIGPAIAAGTLGTILLNAAGGAAIAGLTGALIGMGIPEEEAQYYEGELKAGRFLVTVHADSRDQEARAILQRHGAYDRTSMAAAGHTGQTMQVREEELHARKQPVQTGEVRVRKDVVTEHKTLEVPVQREEVVVERRPASGQASGCDIRAGEEIRIPVTEEQVHLEKEAVVKEEVTVGKRKVQDTEQVAGTVRKEQVRVEQEGNVDIQGMSAAKGGRKPRKQDG